MFHMAQRITIILQGTNTKVFAGFRACKCKENHYRLHRFKSCIFCSKGYVCANESIDLAPGFYWMWIRKSSQENYHAFKKDLVISDSSYKILEFKGRIPHAYACPLAESCLGGAKSLCKEGYIGPLCAVCDEGYYNLMAICRKCPTLPWIVGQMCLVLLGLILLMLFIWKQNVKSNNNNSRSLTDIVLARLKIVIGFYQVSSTTFGSFSYIKWPAPIRIMAKYAKMLQINLLQIVPVNCISHSIKTDAYTHLMASVLITVFTVIMGISCKYIIERYMKMKKFSSQEDRQQKINKYKHTCYRFVSLVIFITFPTTCSRIFQMLPYACHDICSYAEHNCKSYLRADYSVQCKTTKHNIYGYLSKLALVYCLGLPLAILLVLRRARGNCDQSSRNRSRFAATILSFLYENYSPRCWFWEIVEIFRKMFFSAILILLSPESRSSTGLTALLSGLYSVLFAYYKPMNDLFEHWLQLLTLIVSSVNFTLGMLMRIPTNEISSGVNEEGEELILAILLVTSNSAVIIIIAVKYLHSIVKALIALKKEPKCSFSCCFEIFQLVSEAHGEVTTMCDQPRMAKRLIRNIDERPTLGGYSSNLQDVAIDDNESIDNNSDEEENTNKINKLLKVKGAPKSSQSS